MVTIVVKSTVVNIVGDTDLAIAAALNSGATYTNVYSATVMPISNTQAKIIIVYS